MINELFFINYKQEFSITQEQVIPTSMVHSGSLAAFSSSLSSNEVTVMLISSWL